MSKLTASRVALIAAFITSIAAGIAGVAKTVPGKTGETILVVAGMIGAVGTAMTFAVGTMKWDATPVGQAVHAQKLGVTGTAIAIAGLSPVSTATTPAAVASPAAPVAPPEPASTPVSALALAGDPSLQGFGLEQGPGGDEPAEPEDASSEAWLAARAPTTETPATPAPAPPAAETPAS